MGQFILVNKGNVPWTGKSNWFSVILNDMIKNSSRGIMVMNWPDIPKRSQRLISHIPGNEYHRWVMNCNRTMIIHVCFFYCWYYYRCPSFFPVCLSPLSSPPPGLHHIVSLCMGYAYMHICSLANLFQSPQLSSPLKSVSPFRVSMPLDLFCSSDSTHEWDHMVLVFFLLTYVF